MPLIEIVRVEVGDASLRAVVRVTDASLLQTSAVAGVAQKAADLLPGLRRHSCENEADRDFTRELADTQSAHLLEHVACELMALSGSPRSLRGETAWDFARDGHGVYHIRLEFDDDLVALAALREAAVMVEWLLGASPPADLPDVGAAVERLGELRRR